MPHPIVTLTTDFGSGSPYVAQMKGVILSICPQATIVDVTHEIRPQDIAGGAFVLADLDGFYPNGTIHVAVIDPGVGTGRAIVAVDARRGIFIAPDNGLLECVLQRCEAGGPHVVAVESPDYRRSRVSPTFHGRDVMAPAAAHLACGVPIDRLGPAVSADVLVRLDFSEPAIAERRIEGRVMWIDAFGNLITNIAETSLLGRDRPDLRVCCGDIECSALSRAYGDRPDQTPLALIDSGGRLELAVSGGNAAEMFGVRVGEKVTVVW